MISRCKSCLGSGRVMGGGMIFKDCEHCDGDGKISDIPTKTVADPRLIDKRTARYKSAIKRIKELDATITDDQAEKMFLEGYKNV